MARGSGGRAHALWPSAEEPLIGVDLSDRLAAEWLRATFEPEAQRRFGLGASTWNALRARAMVIGEPSRLTIDAARRGLGRDLRRPALCTYSPTGNRLSKVTCFVFESGEGAPSVVVKAMPDARDSARLRHETEIVRVLRRRLSARTASALPLAPLAGGGPSGDYLVVQPLDPLAAGCGRARRRAGLDWLYGFQAETSTGESEWGPADVAVALEHVSYAWGRERAAARPGVRARVEQLLRELCGQPVRRCAVHGDFWRGNLAEEKGELRVYDWEWAQPDGHPFFDLWTLELGDVRQRVEHRREDPGRLLRGALKRINAELRSRALDPRFGLAMAAPALGHLSFRVRRATGLPGGGEPTAAMLMAALEELIGARG